MTPTPEDIALYNKLEAGIRFSAVGDYCLAHDAAHVIAAHTAPLRELAEIGRLAVEYEQLQRDDSASADKMDAHYVAYLNATRAYLAKRPTEKP